MQNFNGREQDILQATQAVEAKVTAPLNEFVARSGVIFRTRRVKSTLIRDAWKQLKVPTVPKFYIEEKERWEENPADPTYRSAMTEYDLQRGDVTVNVYIMLGTTAKFIPEDVTPIDSDDWLEQLDIVGVPRAETQLTRYLQWVKYVAIDEDEIATLIQHISRLSGVVSEADVNAAVDSFRNYTPRDTD